MTLISAAKKLYYRYRYGTLDGVSVHHRYHNIVMHERKAIYFTFPKVASSSIKKVIAKDLGLYRGADIHDLGYPTIPHQYLKRCKGYFKFAFVRNPWDRMVSCYSNKILKDPDFTEGEYEKGIYKYWAKYNLFYAGMSFPAFVDAVCQIPDSEADIHFRCQASFFKTQSGDLTMDFIGRFENLEEDFKSVCERIGLKGAELEHVNRSERKQSYREYYDEITREKIASRYSNTLSRFQYSF